MRLIGEEVKKTENTENLISAQLEPKLKEESNPKGAGRKSGGINEASRQLGISRQEAQRAAKVANLTPEAKEAAVRDNLHRRRLLSLRCVLYYCRPGLARHGMARQGKVIFNTTQTQVKEMTEKSLENQVRKVARQKNYVLTKARELHYGESGRFSLIQPVNDSGHWRSRQPVLLNASLAEVRNFLAATV